MSLRFNRKGGPGPVETAYFPFMENTLTDWKPEAFSKPESAKAADGDGDNSFMDIETLDKTLAENEDKDVDDDVLPDDVKLEKDEEVDVTVKEEPEKPQRVVHVSVDYNGETYPRVLMDKAEHIVPYGKVVLARNEETKEDTLELMYAAAPTLTIFRFECKSRIFVAVAKIPCSLCSLF